MTVSTSTSRIEYTGDAVTTAFSFPYYFLANGDLKVYLDGVLQTITTHYTVAGAGVGAGGTVTFVTAPPNGDLVVIYREVAITQSVDYTPNDPFPANTHEQAIDRLTMITQQLDEEAGRALALPSTSTYSDLTLPDPQAGYFLQWKADLSGLQNVIQVPTSTYTVSAYGQTLIDDADAAAALSTLGIGSLATTDNSWTPTLLDGTGSASEGQTYSTQIGSYTVIGKLVIFSGKIIMTSIGTLTGADVAQIGGFPIAARAANAVGGGVVFYTGGSVNVADANGQGMYMRVVPGSSIMPLTQMTPGTSLSPPVTINEIGATGQLQFNGHYYID